MKDQLEQLINQMYQGGILYAEAVREFKKRFILQVLTETKGNQCQAARELGMHRNTLNRTITELKLADDLRRILNEARGRGRRRSIISASPQKAMAASA